MSPEEEILEEWRANPAFWAREVLGVDMWRDQERALCSWRDHRNTSWRSCNGAGKTLADAVGVLWVGSLWEEVSILTTATTFTQVKGSVWWEISQLIRGAKRPLGCEALTTEIRWPHGSRAFAITAPPHQKDKAKMAGFRGRRGTYVLGDEASGLSPSILEGIRGMLTGSEAHLLLTGNPLDPTTEFKRTFDQPDEVVAKIKTDAFHTPNFEAFGIELEDIVRGTWRTKVTGPYPQPALTIPESVEGMFYDFGRDLRDPRFVARVLADFPEASKDTVIPMHWIEAAFTLGARPAKPDEPTEPVHLGVDVARFGDDDSAIARRRGLRAKIIKAVHGHDTMAVTGAAIIAMRAEQATEVRIDEVGVGGSVVDAGNAQKLPFYGINVGRAASDPEKFFNLRSEAWWGMRERFEATYRALMRECDPSGVPYQPGILLEERDEKLAAELNAPRWRPTPRGQIALELKDVTKSRLGRSPDRADALVNAFIPNAEAEEQRRNLQRTKVLGKW